VQYEIEIDGRVRQVQVHRIGGDFAVDLDGVRRALDVVAVDPHTLSLLDGVNSHDVRLAPDAAGQLVATVNGIPVAVTLNGRRRWGRKDDTGKSGGGSQRLTAPMPGKIVRVLVQVGDSVEPRQALAVIEAMKMENELRAARKGRVTEVHAREGQSVDAGEILLVVVSD
jgi:biotin carboxyl carrier protein